MTTHLATAEAAIPGGRGPRTSPRPTIVVFGTGDADAPRSRMLGKAAEAAGFRVIECRLDPWSGLRDKSVAPRSVILGRVLALLLGYPALICKYLRLPAHDAALVMHPGWLDVLLLWPFARRRGVPIIWDVYLPLHETLIEDRRFAAEGSVPARLLTAFERLACRAAGRLLLDTSDHARYMQSRYGLAHGHARRVFVGAEDESFGVGPADAGPGRRPFNALFYGQFIPLQGVDVIVDAARLLAEAGEEISIVLVGGGQEAGRIDLRLREIALPNLRRIPWIDYGELAGWIRDADVCLGIFGETGKAGRVIPNKVFQAIACRRPVITRRSDAILELIGESAAMKLIPPGDPRALADALIAIRETPPARIRQAVASFPGVGLASIAAQFRDALSDVPGLRVP